eukprot:3824964-Rhodomonas_salina.5
MYSRLFEWARGSVRSKARWSLKATRCSHRSRRIKSLLGMVQGLDNDHAYLSTLLAPTRTARPVLCVSGASLPCKGWNASDSPAQDESMDVAGSLICVHCFLVVRTPPRLSRPHIASPRSSRRQEHTARCIIMVD